MPSVNPSSIPGCFKRPALAFVAAIGLAAVLLNPALAMADSPAFAGSFAGRIFRNSGTSSFSANGTPSSSAYYNAVDFVNANVGWAVGVDLSTFNYYAIKTTNGGSWSVMNTGVTASTGSGFLDVDFVNNFNGWIVGEGGRIISTTNGGTSWTAQTSLVSANLYGVQFLSPLAGFVTGDGGVVLKTTNGGSLWSPISVPTNLSLRAVDFVDPNNGWVVGANAAGTAGVIAHTSNGGSNWTLQNFNSTTGFHDVAFTDSQTGWAVGDNGLALKTTNAGSTWTPVNLNSTTSLYGISWLGTQEAYIVGDSVNGTGGGGSATIRHTSDGGLTWKPEPDNGFGNRFFDVSIAAANSTTVNSGTNVTQTFGGGATTTGGSSFTFPSITTPGTLLATAGPLAVLSQQIQNDFQTFPGYALVGAGTAAWTVAFDGQFTGSVTMKFGYDPALLAGLDPSHLVMIRRDTTTGAMSVLPATLIGGNTIQVQSPGFSTFVLAVPEPSTFVLAGFGLVAVCVRRRHRKSPSEAVLR